MTLQDDKLDSRYNKTFLEHLNDLRKTLIWSIVFLFCGIALAFPLAPKIFQVLAVPARDAGLDTGQFLSVIKVGAGFTLAVDITFWSGLLISFPFITIAVAKFILPGLTLKEKQIATKSLLAALLLFVVGATVCYFFVARMAIEVMLLCDQWMGVQCPWFDASDYAVFIVKLMIGFGLAFEVPMILVALGLLGIVSSMHLRKWRRHAIVIILIIAAVLTPPDVYSQVLMAIPMILLYEASIWAIFAVERGRSQSELVNPSN